MKDWDWHKKLHIDTMILNQSLWLNDVEEMISSPIERIVYINLYQLQENGFDPGDLVIIPQARVGRYTVDFLVTHTTTTSRIVVECDGHDFHEKTRKQAAHDKKRDRFFIKEGYQVLRYTGSEICEKPVQICRDIMDILLSKTNGLSI